MIFDAGLTNPKAFINYNRNNHFRVFVKLLKFYTLLFLVILTPNHIFSQTYRPDTLNGQTVRTCSGTFYDSGADTGNYSNNENWIVTFCADSGRIKIDFLSLDLRNEGGDTLKIYDGENTSAPRRQQRANHCRHCYSAKEISLHLDASKCFKIYTWLIKSNMT